MNINKMIRRKQLLIVLLSVYNILAAHALIPLTLTDCGSSSGCFRVPEDCNSLVTCKIIVKYMKNVSDNTVHIDLYGKHDGWLAFGLTEKTKQMDGVHGEFCKLGFSSPELQGFITEGTDVEDQTLPTGTKLFSSTYENGAIICRIDRNFKDARVNESNIYKRPISAIGYMYDASSSYHVMVSWGPVEKKGETGEVECEEHGVGDYYWSKNKVILTEAKNAETEGFKWKIVIIHGIFMTFAWILFALNGMFTARYAKEIFDDVKICGTKVWFATHRGMMICCAIFTLVGLIVVLVGRADFEEFTKAHTILGFICIGLTFLNGIGGFLRPGPNHKFRTAFNWVHRLGGLLAFILSVICLLTGFFWVNVIPIPLAGIVITIIFMVILDVMGCKMAYEAKQADQPSVTYVNMNAAGGDDISVAEQQPQQSQPQPQQTAAIKQPNKLTRIRNISVMIVVPINAILCIISVIMLSLRISDLEEYL